jgi:hypothetical protein
MLNIHTREHAGAFQDNTREHSISQHKFLVNHFSQLESGRAFQDNTREHSIRIIQHTQESTVLVNKHILKSGRALQYNITPIHRENEF